MMLRTELKNAGDEIVQPFGSDDLQRPNVGKLNERKEVLRKQRVQKACGGPLVASEWR